MLPANDAVQGQPAQQEGTSSAPDQGLIPPQAPPPAPAADVTHAVHDAAPQGMLPTTGALPPAFPRAVDNGILADGPSTAAVAAQLAQPPLQSAAAAVAAPAPGSVPSAVDSAVPMEMDGSVAVVAPQAPAPTAGAVEVPAALPESAPEASAAAAPASDAGAMPS